MKDAELKELIRSAYKTERSEKRAAFLRAHRQRDLKLSELLLMQLKYMRLQYAAILLFLFGSAALFLSGAGSEQIRNLAAFIPFPAVLVLSGLGSSQYYGMDELEMSTRLSRRMLKALRLVIIGCAGLVSIVTTAAFLNIFFSFSVLFTLLITGVPYLLTTSACMALIRRWHAKENIYGCTAIAACVCVFSLAADTWPAVAFLAFSRIWCFALFAAVLLWTVLEFEIYLKESEEYQWSLC